MPLRTAYYKAFFNYLKILLLDELTGCSVYDLYMIS